MVCTFLPNNSQVNLNILPCNDAGKRYHCDQFLSEKWGQARDFFSFATVYSYDSFCPEKCCIEMIESPIITCIINLSMHGMFISYNRHCVDFFLKGNQTNRRLISLFFSEDVMMRLQAPFFAVAACCAFLSVAAVAGEAELAHAIYVKWTHHHPGTGGRSRPLSRQARIQRRHARG